MTTNGSVLLVDDDAYTLDALRRLLSRDLTIHTVPDGPSALILMKEERFAVVVTDLVMPGMSGFELLNSLETEFPETVCIVLSGRPSESFPTKMPKNVFRYLEKPCCIDILVDTLNGAFAEYVLNFHRDTVFLRETDITRSSLV